jgi:hypothetical protein
LQLQLQLPLSVPFCLSFRSEAEESAVAFLVCHSQRESTVAFAASKKLTEKPAFA